MNVLCASDLALKPLVVVQWYTLLNAHNKVWGMYLVGVSTSNHECSVFVIPTTALVRSCHLISHWGHGPERTCWILWYAHAFMLILTHDYLILFCCVMYLGLTWTRNKCHRIHHLLCYLNTTSFNNAMVEPWESSFSCYVLQVPHNKPCFLMRLSKANLEAWGVPFASHCLHQGTFKEHWGHLECHM